jgi:hypothetical protein
MRHLEQATVEGRKLPYRLLPALLFVLVMLGTLGPSSYFLHFDNATLHQNAADLVIGQCWGPSGKPAITLLLALTYWLGGINPLWDMVWLTILGMITMLVFYRITAKLAGTRRWAMLGTLWFLTLPSILYYTRIHMGYPLAFFLLGMLLQSEERYGWAGVAFGMAPTTHANFWVPLLAWLGWSFLLYRGEGRIGKFARLILGLLIPILILEFVRFLFLGKPMGWVQSVLGNVRRHSSFVYQTTWLHIPVMVIFSNGWLNAVLLLVGLAYPAVRRGQHSQLDAAYLTGWSVLGAYALWTGIFHKELVPRMITGVYPLLAMTSTFVAMQLTRLLRERLSLPIWQIVRRVGGAAFVALLGVTFVNNVLDAAVGSRTAYNVIDRAIEQATDTGLPVRYFGNYHAGYFFALKSQAETSINETSLDIITGDRRAVLIFEGGIWGPHETADALADDSRFNPADYAVEVYPHLRLYRPYIADDGRAATARLVEAGRVLPPVRSPQAPVSTVSIWWPREPDGIFQARYEPSEYIYYYQGGCATPPEFGQGNYYHVLAEKAALLWAELRVGRVGHALNLIVTWLRQ